MRPLRIASDELNLHFEVTAVLIAGNKRLRFDTRVLRDRRITVR